MFGRPVNDEIKLLRALLLAQRVRLLRARGDVQFASVGPYVLVQSPQRAMIISQWRSDHRALGG